jgi:hypothetical protein
MSPFQPPILLSRAEILRGREVRADKRAVLYYLNATTSFPPDYKSRYWRPSSIGIDITSRVAQTTIYKGKKLLCFM